MRRVAAQAKVKVQHGSKPIAQFCLAWENGAGVTMDTFEFYFSFYGLLLGLSVAAVVGGLATVLNTRHRRSLGVLTPLLAVFIMLDITSFWLFAWANRALITVTWGMMFGGLVVAVTYYLAASLIFPREQDESTSLEDHYWMQKRAIIAGILVANFLIVAFTFVASPLAWGDAVFIAWQVAYFFPLLLLMLSNGRRMNIAVLSYLILFYLVSAFNLFPSTWGQATGV